MQTYAIVTDACCDMNADILEREKIEVIPMLVQMSTGREFLHYPDFRNYPAQQFYREIREGASSNTTQITPAQYEEYFTPLLEAGRDILYVCFSSGMSGTWHSSCVAASSLQERYPERTILSVDSLCACGGEGVFAVKAAQNRREGMSLEENADWLIQNRLRLAHYFTVGSLDCLRRGGRISAVSAVLGTTLNIKPLLYVDEKGTLQVLRKVRGRKTSLREMIVLTKKTILSPEEQTLYISQTDCASEAEEFGEMIRREIPCRDVIITTVGPVVGTHTGPDHMCLFSWGTGRAPEEYLRTASRE